MYLGSYFEYEAQQTDVSTQLTLTLCLESCRLPPQHRELRSELGARNVGKLKIIKLNSFADARYAQSFESP